MRALGLALLLLLVPSVGWAADTQVATYDCNSDFNNLASFDSAHWTNITNETGVATSGTSSTPANVCQANTTGADTGIFYSASAFSGDQYAQAVLTVTSTAAGTGPCLIVRAQAASQSYYRACFSHAASDNITLTLVNGGSFSAVTGWPKTQAWTDGDTAKLRVVGSTLTVTLTTAAFSQTGTDATVTGGKPGIGHSTDTTAHTLDSLDFGNAADASTTLFRTQGDLTGLGTGGKFKKDPSQ